LKQFFAKLAAEWKLIVLPALIKLGFWGVAAVAMLDSSSIPVPMDAILAVYIWNNKRHFLAYALLAAAGSAAWFPMGLAGPVANSSC
jgi:membrane protein YqaA with SNARE-associated domain